jgi:ADP-ribose pyrophosphatase
MTAESATEPGSMKDARLVESEILLPKPKRFVREALVMPDGYPIDWYYVDTPASVMVVPVTADGGLVLVRQYRHNLKAHGLELPAGMISDGEAPVRAALRELREETGYVLDGAELEPLGAYYSLPSETNKYTHVFLAQPVMAAGSPVLDTEIEKYFDMSVVEMPFDAALDAIGDTINSMETVGALMLARTRIKAAAAR